MSNAVTAGAAAVSAAAVSAAAAAAGEVAVTVGDDVTALGDGDDNEDEICDGLVLELLSLQAGLVTRSSLGY